MGVTRLRAGMALTLAASLLAASCSVIDDQLNGSDPVETTEPTNATESGEETTTETEDDADGDADAEDAVASIWTRADDGALRPDQPTSEPGGIAAPGVNGSWTIVGSIFDYQANKSRPAVWETTTLESTGEWIRTDIGRESDKSARMSNIARSDSLDVAVGNRGLERGQRPAVWVRPSGGEWEPIDPAQFAGNLQERLFQVAIAADDSSMLAIGERVNTDNKRNPIIWSSVDGSLWEPVPELPFAEDGSELLGGISMGPARFVVTGSRVDGLQQTATAWSSPDGVQWSEAEVELPTGASDSYLAEVTWFNDRYVAVGGVATNSVYLPAAWTSLNGLTWEYQSRDFGLNDDGRSTTRGFGASSVTNAGERLVATASYNFMQHVWTSTDGTAWTPLDNIWDLRENGVSVFGLAADDEQVLLTTGEPSIIYHEPEGEYQVSSISQNLLPFPIDIPFVNDITATDDGWVTVGGASTRSAAGGVTEKALSWTSPDGLSWSVDGRFPQASLGPMHSVTGTSDRLVAAGTETVSSAVSRSALGRGLLWESSATGWSELEASALENRNNRITLATVANAGDDVIAGGWTYVGDNIDAMLVDSAASEFGERVSLGHSGSDDEQVTALCGNSSGIAAAFVRIDSAAGDTNFAPLVRSAEGAWTDALIEGEALSVGDSGVNDCTFGKDGFLAVGWTLDGNNEDVGLWSSTDGQSWSPVAGPAEFSSDANQWVTSVATTETGYLLAGNDASSGEILPVVWFGSGEEWQQIVVGEDTVDMVWLNVGFSNGQIVVVGQKNGAERVYTTTLDELVTELANAA